MQTQHARDADTFDPLKADAALSGMRPGLTMVGNFLSSSTGVRGVCEELAGRLSAAGWQVLTTSDRQGRIARLLDMLASVWRHRHRYAVAQVDVYSGPAFLWARAVCRLLRQLGKPYVLTLHGGNLPAFSRRHPRAVRRLLTSAAVVTAPSRYLYDQMRPYRDSLHLLPNPIDLCAYPFVHRQRPTPSLVWLRTFHAIYAPEIAVRVVAALVPEFPNVHLTMLGPDGGDGSLLATRRLASDLGVGDHVSIAGRVPKSEVPAGLGVGDVFLNTSTIDNAPVSVLEAMACGLCVVSTDVGGIPYLLRHEHDALLVPPGDPQAMSAAVRRLLLEPQLAGRLSHNAREEAHKFDWSIVLPQWETLLSRVAAGYRE
ncbi:MAG: glycosyltransferase family 4 protein [Chloroflexia bacterium]